MKKATVDWNAWEDVFARLDESQLEVACDGQWEASIRIIVSHHHQVSQHFQQMCVDHGSLARQQAIHKR